MSLRTFTLNICVYLVNAEITMYMDISINACYGEAECPLVKKLKLKHCFNFPKVCMAYNSHYTDAISFEDGVARVISSFMCLVLLPVRFHRYGVVCIVHKSSDVRLKPIAVDVMLNLRDFHPCPSVDLEPHHVVIMVLHSRRNVSSFGPTHYNGRTIEDVNRRPR